jgi:hypothetical protein
MTWRDSGRRLLAALTDATPAFAPHNAAERITGEVVPSRWRRLLAALTDATPAFAPTGTQDRSGTPARPQGMPAHTPRHNNEPDTPTALPATTGLGRYSTGLARRPAPERLALRSRLPLAELRLVELVAQTSLNARDLTRDLIRALDRNGDLIRALDRNGDLTRELTRALDCTHDLDPDVVPDPTLHLTLELTRALDRNRDLADLLDRDVTGNRDRVVHMHIRARARALAAASSAALRAALTRASDRASDRDLVAALADEIRRADVSDRLIEDLAVVLTAVTDFTTADLADLDTRKVDLRGVQWSALTTRWPPGWEHAIRVASIQLDPEWRPDLYEVRHVPRVPAVSCRS